MLRDIVKLDPFAEEHCQQYCNRFNSRATGNGNCAPTLSSPMGPSSVPPPETRRRIARPDPQLPVDPHPLPGLNPSRYRLLIFSWFISSAGSASPSPCESEISSCLCTIPPPGGCLICLMRLNCVSCNWDVQNSWGEAVGLPLRDYDSAILDLVNC